MMSFTLLDPSWALLKESQGKPVHDEPLSSAEKGEERGLFPARSDLKKPWPGDSPIETQATGLEFPFFSDMQLHPII